MAGSVNKIETIAYKNQTIESIPIFVYMQDKTAAYQFSTEIRE